MSEPARATTSPQCSADLEAQSTPRVPTRIEWPTVLVAVCIYGAFAALTLGYEHLPWFVVLVVGGYVVAWHGSLQHEVVHGHPTPWPTVNTALVFPSLWLWLPFEHYRRTHLLHHRVEQLTAPGIDPESSYCAQQHFSALPAWRRALLECQRTLAGYMLIGPVTHAASVYAAELKRLFGDASDAIDVVKIWARHSIAVALVLTWVLVVCDIPLIEYVLLFVLPGMSLTLLRSFAEHQAAQVHEGRTSIVEAEPPLALMFLNNNLHILHHREPGRAWYELPRCYADERSALEARHAKNIYKGYREIARRFGVRRREPVAHPYAAS